jgi:hypothetical protein
MKNNLYLSILVLSIGLFSGSVSAQKLDSLSTQVINVNSSYNPTVEEAYRIPLQKDSLGGLIQEQRALNYGIKPIQVASTFNPQKGSIQPLAIFNPKSGFSHYFYSDYGMNSMPRVSTSLNFEKLSVFANYSGTRDGIPDILSNVNAQNAELEINFKDENRARIWTADFNYKLNSQFWYGILDKDLYSNYQNLLNEKQMVHGVNGRLSYHKRDAKISQVFLDLKANFDSYNTNELIVKTGLDFELNWDVLRLLLPLRVDYQSTQFDEFYPGSSAVGFDNNYEFVNATSGVSLTWNPNDKTYINLGALADYFKVRAPGESKFYFLPQLEAALQVNEALSFSARLQSELNTNSFGALNNENPWISPSLNLKPSYTPYNISIATNVVLFDVFDFSMDLGYKNTEDQTIFTRNALVSSPEFSYQLGNSFTVIYDEVQTTYFKVNLSGNVSEKVDFDFRILYQNFKTANLANFYNEPALKTSLDMRYSFNQKWSANLFLFAASESEDLYLGTALTNDAFVDLNLKGSYNLNKQARLSLKLNNVLNQNYSEFSGYQVQGFQVLGGFSYLFNL